MVREYRGNQGFDELKRLFNAECERLAYSETKNDNCGVPIILASLLDGFKIEQAKGFLFQASEIFTRTHKVSASEIYKNLG